MMIVLTTIEFCLAIATGVALGQLLKRPIGSLLKSTMEAPVAADLAQLFQIAVVTMSTACGAGFLIKSHNCSAQSYFMVPQETIDYVAFAYNTILAAVVGGYTLTAAVVFTLTVLHVSIRRTRIAANKE